MKGIRIQSGAFLALMMGLSIASVGCKSAPQTGPAPQSSSAAQSKTRRFQLKGKLVSIDKKTKELVVDGENIPGFMGAMTMPYPVKDEKILEQLTPGDVIKADVVVEGGDYWLENVVVQKKAG